MSQFDKDIKVGDLIWSYHKGLHRCTKIERRFLTSDDLRYSAYKGSKIGDEYAALIYYKPVLDCKGKPRKGPVTVCDASYCTRLDPSALKKLESDEIKAVKAKYQQIRDLI